MNRCVFFTKTDWVEPPRLRHQLALLLKDNGHQVLFFEKPNNSFLQRQLPSTQNETNLKFHRTSELCHHKLRLNSILRHLNAYWEKKSITKIIKISSISKTDVVINFNYDYFFLRSLFPSNKIITIINDDFWCRAILGYEKPLKDALRLTCINSDAVLTVSEPLLEQLSEFCNPQLLLPWSNVKYSHANYSPERTTLLFWGYINNRLNYEYIGQLADALYKTHSRLLIELVGPVEQKIKRSFYDLIERPNVNQSDPQDLASLDFKKTLAAFIPYVEGNTADDVTTLPNKAFPMLANGLPLLITGMPNFLKAPFVLRLEKTMEEDLRLIASLPNIFDGLQSSISTYVNQNTWSDRYRQIRSHFD